MVRKYSVPIFMVYMVFYIVSSVKQAHVKETAG